MCERLIIMAMETRELTKEECDIIADYSQQLHATTNPLCEKQK